MSSTATRQAPMGLWLPRSRSATGGRVLVFVRDAFAEMPGEVRRICGIIAHDLARTHVPYYNSDAKRTKGMFRQCIQKTWGHTAHRGWARLLLDRAQDLITHGPAHRGASGAAHGAPRLGPSPPRPRLGPHHPRPGAPRRQRCGNANSQQTKRRPGRPLYL